MGGIFADHSVVVILIYLMAILALGAIKVPNKGIVDFHLAGRMLRPVILIGTFCATIVGASSTIGMTGLGFGKGLPGAWWMLSGSIGLLILAYFFSEKIRQTNCNTLPQLVGTFYGEQMRTAASLLIAVSWIGVIAVQIVASGKVLGAIFGGDETIFMIACTAVFVIYTVHGGQSSVVRTDLVQILIIVVGMTVLFVKSGNAAGFDILIHQKFPTSELMGGWDVISMVILVGSAYLVGPDLYSRIFSARSSKEAKISAAISALILIPLAFLITSLGIFARSLYPNAAPEGAILSLLSGLMDPGIEGLVSAALLAAFMSSADTSLMTATSILTLDLYKRSRIGSNTSHLLIISKVSVLILGAIALILAISLPNIIKTLLITYTIFTSGLLFPIMAGFYKERFKITSHGALASLTGGGAAAIFFGQSYPLLGMAISAILLFGVSWLEQWYGLPRHDMIK